MLHSLLHTAFVSISWKPTALSLLIVPDILVATQLALYEVQSMNVIAMYAGVICRYGKRNLLWGKYQLIFMSRSLCCDWPRTPPYCIICTCTVLRTTVFTSSYRKGLYTTAVILPRPFHTPKNSWHAYTCGPRRRKGSAYTYDGQWTDWYSR